MKKLNKNDKGKPIVINSKDFTKEILNISKRAKNGK